MKNVLAAKLAYRENAARGATPIALVVMLYDAAIDDLRRAVAAMKERNIEARATACSHALLVIQQLQGTLDFERGGAAARQFEQFYNLVRAKLLEAQLRDAPELMQQQVRFLAEVRDCWRQAEQQLQPKAKSELITTAIMPSRAGEDGGSTSEWNA